MTRAKLRAVVLKFIGVERSTYTPVNTGSSLSNPYITFQFEKCVVALLFILCNFDPMT